MLKRGDLRRARRSVELLTQPGDLAAVLVDIELLAAAQLLFRGKISTQLRERLLSGLMRSLRRNYPPRRFGLLLAKTLELEVLRLKDHEMFEVRVHGSTAHRRTSSLAS